jgi:hypothetical protein
MPADGIVTITHIVRGKVSQTEQVQHAPMTVNPKLLYLVTSKDFVDDEREHAPLLRHLLSNNK